MIIKPRQIVKTENKAEEPKKPVVKENKSIKQNTVKKAPRKIEEEDLKFLLSDEEE